jgi:adenylosuccinate synthase
MIGPGALISPDIFMSELVMLDQWRAKHRLDPASVLVDWRAHVITKDQIVREGQSDLAERIGSTSTIAREGIGQAQADRVMRSADCVRAKDFDWSLYHRGDRMMALSDIPRLLHRAYENGQRILLEGTQGTGLSLTTGAFPYTTSRNTTAAGLAADAGIAPTLIDRVIMVCRTFPIRVAGSSGPFHSESLEIDWEDLGIDPNTERTTVTKKVRRVATFSIEQVYEAAYLNGATDIALTFADYVDESIAGISGSDPGYIDGPVGDFVQKIQEALRIPVTFVGTGPYSVIETGRAMWLAA